MKKVYDVLMRRGLVSEWVPVWTTSKAAARRIVKQQWPDCTIDAVMAPEDY